MAKFLECDDFFYIWVKSLFHMNFLCLFIFRLPCVTHSPMSCCFQRIQGDITSQLWQLQHFCLESEVNFSLTLQFNCITTLGLTVCYSSFDLVPLPFCFRQTVFKNKFKMHACHKLTFSHFTKTKQNKT